MSDSHYTRIDFVSETTGCGERLSVCKRCRRGMAFGLGRGGAGLLDAWESRHREHCNAAPTEPCGPPEGE